MTPVPDNIAEAVDELEDAVVDYADCGAEMSQRKHDARARLDALIGEVVAERDAAVKLWQATQRPLEKYTIDAAQEQPR